MRKNTFWNFEMKKYFLFVKILIKIKIFIDKQINML